MQLAPPLQVPRCPKVERAEAGPSRDAQSARTKNPLIKTNVTHYDLPPRRVSALSLLPSSFWTACPVDSLASGLRALQSNTGGSSIPLGNRLCVPQKASI